MACSLRLIFLAYVALVLTACVASQVTLMALCRLCVCVHVVCRFPSYFSRRVSSSNKLVFLGYSVLSQFSWRVSACLLVS